MLVPTPSNSHRASSACLASLPPELKTMIIGEVQACEDKFKGILALSVVDRVFATLVQPLLWKTVDLSGRSSHSLLFFIDSILPRHAAHIASISLPRDESPREAEEGPGGPLSDKAEHLAGRPGKGGDLGRVEWSCRTLLRSAIVRRLPALRTVFFQYEDTPLPDPLSVPTPNPLDPTILALTSERLWPGIKSLKVWSDSEHANGNHFSHVLSSFTCLTSLTLLFRPWSDHVEPPLPILIAKIIASMVHLNTLTIIGGNIVTADSAQYTWTCPLLSLTLLDCADPTFDLASLHIFLSHFSSTLSTLTLDLDSSDERPPPTLLTKAFLLPSLRSLNLSTELQGDFLSSFHECKLAFLKIGRARKIKVVHWTRLVATHRESLRRVTVTSDTSLGVDKVEALGFLCRGMGIEFVVEKRSGRERVSRWSTDDSEDESTDDSDESTDEDDSEEEG